MPPDRYQTWAIVSIAGVSLDVELTSIPHPTVFVYPKTLDALPILSSLLVRAFGWGELVMVAQHLVALLVALGVFACGVVRRAS
jgi:hypothetical protein